MEFKEIDNEVERQIQCALTAYLYSKRKQMEADKLSFEDYDNMITVVEHYRKIAAFNKFLPEFKP